MFYVAKVVDDKLVAPYTGAWIEIKILSISSRCSVSHPTRVRGLKYFQSDHTFLRDQSHPTRVRGLKYVNQSRCEVKWFVAPYTGAWIEIPLPAIL